MRRWCKSWWERWEKCCEKVYGLHMFLETKCFTQRFTFLLHGEFHIFIHWFSTLAIDFFLDFFDLVAKDEIKFKAIINLLDAMHYGGVIFDTNFGGDFGGTEA